MIITYLLGAGASANALPLMEDMASSILEIKDSLLAEFSFKDEKLNVNNENYLTKPVFESFIDDLRWLSDQCKSHQSIDTYAKKLYITREWNLLKKLKTSLSLYFMIVQAKSSLDLRYDSFFASILTEHHLKFPDNLRILSWNYDTQIEMAYSGFSGDFRYESCQGCLNIAIKNCKSSNEYEGFSIVKLNGTAGIYNDNNNRNFYIIQQTNKLFSIEFLNDILKKWVVLRQMATTKDITQSSLSFAWEGQEDQYSIIDTAITNTKNTEVLVVIGYSFPLFNRSADRKIIKAMAGLKKVYFQAPDANALKERFLAIRDDLKDDQLLVRFDTNQFAFPNEF